MLCNSWRYVLKSPICSFGTCDTIDTHERSSTLLPFISYKPDVRIVSNIPPFCPYLLDNAEILRLLSLVSAFAILSNGAKPFTVFWYSLLLSSSACAFNSNSSCTSGGTIPNALSGTVEVLGTASGITCLSPNSFGAELLIFSDVWGIIFLESEETSFTDCISDFSAKARVSNGSIFIRSNISPIVWP